MSGVVLGSDPVGPRADPFASLLPIVPNDGGYIARLTLRAVSPAVAQLLAWAGVAAGFALAYAWSSYVVGLLIAFGALGLKGAGATDATRPPMSRRAALALGLGYLLAIAAYALILFGLLGNEAALNLIWPSAKSPA